MLRQDMQIMNDKARNLQREWKTLKLHAEVLNMHVEVRMQDLNVQLKHSIVSFS